MELGFVIKALTKKYATFTNFPIVPCFYVKI